MNISNKIKLSYEEYRKICEHLATRCECVTDSGEVDSIYPIPRSGYFAALIISQRSGLPIVFDKKDITKRTLIVDDITDSGKTLSEFPDNYKAVVFAKERSEKFVTPNTNLIGAIIGDNDWVIFPDEHDTTIEDNVVRMLEYIGENPNREGLIGTPDRIRRMWGEIFRGYDPSRKPKITVFDNGVDGVAYDNMVIDEGCFYSMCEHHMMPFFGHYWFAYIPNPKGKILGISKVGRVVDYCAAKLQIQERLVHDIIEMLKEALGNENPPLGIALVMKGEHLCKSMRGVKKKGVMTSSCLLGAFKDDAQVRAEFMQLVNSSKNEG